MVESITRKEIKMTVTDWLMDAFAKENGTDPFFKKLADDFLKYMRTNGYVYRDIENERKYPVSNNVCAVVWTHEDGADAYDVCFNWETAQVMSNEGYKVQAIKGDGHLTKEELQKLCDYELESAIDCFGERHRK